MDAEKITLEFVRKEQAHLVDIFMHLGRDYNAEIAREGETIDMHERFLKSIVSRQGEPERWLALFKLDQEHIGFCHFKIDRQERPGWGYIMEFYIISSQRRKGFGRRCCGLVSEILRNQGAETVWLASDPQAEEFWRACGFRETGEFERDQKIMITNLQAKSRV